MNKSNPNQDCTANTPKEILELVEINITLTDDKKAMSRNNFKTGIWNVC